MVLMSLDMFVFSLPTLAYQELQRSTSWKHARTSRVGARDANQYKGPGDDTINLSGILAPELTGLAMTLEELRGMGDTGQAFALVDGIGTVFGAFVIESVDETQTYHDANGQAKRIDFKIVLSRVDDNRAVSLLYNPLTLGAISAVKSKLQSINPFTNGTFPNPLAKLKSAQSFADLKAIGSLNPLDKS